MKLSAEHNEKEIDVQRNIEMILNRAQWNPQTVET